MIDGKLAKGLLGLNTRQITVLSGPLIRGKTLGSEWMPASMWVCSVRRKEQMQTLTTRPRHHN